MKESHKEYENTNTHMALLIYTGDSLKKGETRHAGQDKACRTSIEHSSPVPHVLGNQENTNTAECSNLTLHKFLMASCGQLGIKPSVTVGICAGAQMNWYL
jgi:hypothetical protein